MNVLDAIDCTHPPLPQRFEQTIVADDEIGHPPRTDRLRLKGREQIAGEELFEQSVRSFDRGEFVADILR